MSGEDRIGHSSPPLERPLWPLEHTVHAALGHDHDQSLPHLFVGQPLWAGSSPEQVVVVPAEQLSV